MLGKISEIESRQFGDHSLNDLYLRTEKENVFFIFTPKVACSFIKRCLITSIYGNFSNFNAGYYMNGWDAHSFVHALSHEVLRVDGRVALRVPDRKIIAFCRNPYSRIVSAYRNKICSPPAPEQEHWQWMRREIMFDAFRKNDSKTLFSDFANHIPFSNFVDFVSEFRPEATDFHWAPQINLINSDLIEGVQIIKLEELSDVLPQVWRETFGTEIPISPQIKFNESNYSDFGNVINEESADKIYEIYKADFEFFDYTRDSWKEVS